MIESLDARVSTPEQRAGLTLLRRFRAYRESVRLLGADHVSTKLHAIRLHAAERLYDSLPKQDAQVRDALDDALLTAGCVRQ